MYFEATALYNTYSYFNFSNTWELFPDITESPSNWISPPAPWVVRPKILPVYVATTISSNPWDAIIPHFSDVTISLQFYKKSSVDYSVLTTNLISYTEFHLKNICLKKFKKIYSKSLIVCGVLWKKLYLEI